MTTTASYESFPLPPPPDSPSLPASSATDPSPFARLRRFLAGAGTSSAPPQDAAAPTQQEPQQATPTSAAADCQRYPTARQALESALGAAAGAATPPAPPPPVPQAGTTPTSRAVSRSRSRDPAASSSSPAHSSSSPSRTSHPHSHSHSRTRSHPPPPSPSSRSRTRSHPHPHAGADHASHPTAPNERFVRPLRLSGAPRPSVRVSLQQAKTSGILSSSVGASSSVGVGSAPGGGGGGGALAGDVDSPTFSEGYFAAGVGAGAAGTGAGWASGSDAQGPPFLAASSAGGSAAGGGGGDVRKRRLSIPNLGASFPGFKRGRSTAGGGGAGGGGGGAAGASDEEDDARSVMSAGTGGGYRSSPTAYELMRRLRGEGLSKTYWIKDESARECFQCQSTFTTFRRKHHCRICGQIFCINCASHILPRLGHLERVRVCDGCRPTALKHESSSASSSRPFDDGASAYRYRAQSQSQVLARDEQHALAQVRALYRPSSASGLSAAAGPGTPYHHRHHSRLSTSSLPDIGDDDDDGRRSRASSGRMRSPIFEEGEREAEPPPRSPKSSIAHKQLEQQQQQAAQAQAQAAGAGGGEAQGAGSAGDGAEALPATAVDGERAPVDPSAAGLHSPALSAAAPFRRELGDEEHETADEAGGSDDEEGKNGSALLLRPPQQGLGLDLDGRGGGFGDLDGASHPSPHIRIDPSRPGSTTFPPDSPFFPRLDRSMSRVSGHLVPRLPDESFGDAFLGGIDPDVYHADAFRAAEAVDIPLSPAALAHIRRMIAQSLAREQVPHAAAWEPELERLLFDVADRLATLDEADLASGGPLDVHAHVRVKRIPGGRPRDSEFVNGVVFTKNVMHKKMAREMTNPKVMLLSFPLDFLRADGKYLDLDTVLRQEKEYLQNVVARIQNHFPQIILVERNVSSRALELLRDLRDVAVARHVKRVALDAVARSFGAEVVQSPHALLDSKVGRCARFRVQTFVHPLIPGGRKTLLRFEGSTGGDRQTGCTLVLRGASMDDLGKVKRIVNMLVLVVYNAKLEGYLLHDERIEVLPPIPSSSSPTPTSPVAQSPRKPADGLAQPAPVGPQAPVDVDEDTTETLPLPAPPPLAARASSAATTTARISATLAPYQTAALSGSPLVQYPPPYPLARMAAEDRRVREMREMRDKEEMMRILVEEEQAATASSVGGGSSILSGSSISASSSSAALDMLGGAGGEASLSYDSLSSLGSVLGSAQSEMGFPVYHVGRDAQQQHRAELAVLQQPEELARQSQFADAEEEHALHLAAWEAYHRAHEDSFDPHDFQQLFVLESLVQVSPRGEPVRLCRPPEVHSIAFYGEGDTTIGQYLKFADAALRSGEPCPSPSCHESLRNHRRIFVHDGHVLQVSWEPWNNDVLRGAVGMSTECRHVGCRCGGRLVRAATETVRLSFGKFLELSFYPSHRLACADDACGHDGQLEHVRHWHYGGIRVAIRIDKVDLRDVVAPPRNVKVRPDRQLELRNAEYQQVLRRSEAFFASVQVRVAAFKHDCIPAERLDECKAALGDFSARCEADRKAIARLLRSAYEHAHDSNGTEMTAVRRALQEKSHAFDAEWASFVKRITPFDMQDMRRVSVAQLKRYLPDGTQRGASGPLPPAIEVEEHLEDGSSTGDDKSPDSPSAVDRERLEEGETQALRDAEVRIDPPVGSSLNSLDPLASSTATVMPPPISTSTSLPRPPPLSRTNSSFRRSSFGSDFESDSTICADGEPTTIQPRTTSPFIKRRQLPAMVDETSAAESELETPIWLRRRGAGGQVASLVSAYDSGAVGGTLSRDTTIKAKHGSSPARPSLRRSQTEKPPPPSRPRPKATSTFHETDSSYARIVGVSHLMAESSLSAAAARPSRIPSRKPTKSLAPGPPHEDDIDELAGVLGPGLGVSTSPTSTRPSSRASSRAPSSRSASRATSPTASRSRSAFSRAPDGSLSSRPPLKPSSSSRSTIKGKSRASAQLSESSDAGALKPSRGIGLSRPTTSTANKVTRRAVSTGTGRHVSNMRRHFENVGRQNEKQQAMRKRARPIITSQPTVQIFENIRDAIKEDSDDDDGAGSDAESGGADDEFDDEQEPPERDDEAKLATDGTSPAKNAHLRPPEPSTAPSTSAPTGISSMTMSDALARSSHGADPAGGLLMPPPALEQHSTAEPSDSDFPSIPPSPIMPDSFTFPRMSEGESSGAERRSIFNAFSSLWNYRNGDFSPLAYPTLATEHVYADNPVVLRDDEPTSLIAHALSSKRYYQAFENANLPRIREGLGVASAGDEHTGEVTSFATQHDSDVAQTIEEILRASTQRSFKLGDVELGDISARCTVFWVEQFEALRRQCGCDKQFVESLSRCFKWDAAGGKSKVDFMKTLDDRFIVKQLSRPEMEVFARFAPAYFQYMADALFQGKPTVLAKVFGIYRISLGKEYRNVDFLVMENLFYGRQLKQIFDLKGSTRNRRADENNPVLLDENLLEVSLKNPFYVREESKQFIKQAIFNDSQFLSDLNVMDYSLVVGVDAVKSELLVGIVDYIRTYTWDKRIESWVKETTFLGGASKTGGPTVITPKQYKLRFREAIDGYLLLAPTPWLDLKSLLPIQPRADPPKPDAASSSDVPASGAANAPVPPSAYPAPPPSDTSSIVAASLAMAM
ncbi:hypothetical protein JCM8208_006239 [Rhodotorula glutinis]